MSNFGLYGIDLYNDDYYKRAIFGLFLRREFVRVNTTWIRPDPTEITFIGVHLEGSGGGGGGAKGGSGKAPAAGSGGGGAYAWKLFRVSDLPLSVLISIGVGGIGGLGATPTDGGNGTDTTFGPYFTAGAGKGGSANNNGTSMAGFGEGGIATGGDINIRGEAGEAGRWNYGSYGYGSRGGRAAGPFAGGIRAPGYAQGSNANGVAADPNSGSGGNGGTCKYDDATAAADGAPGGSGLTVIDYYS